MDEVLFVRMASEPCPGPSVPLPGGWVMHLCDDCVLFPCPQWRAIGTTRPGRPLHVKETVPDVHRTCIPQTHPVNYLCRVNDMPMKCR